MAQIPAMLFASNGASVSSHPAANASSRDFDAILAALTPDTQMPHLPAIASLNEYGSLHDYSAFSSPKFENPVPVFANFNVSLTARTIPTLKSSVALPVMTAPVTTRDYREQDRGTPKPAAPSRAAVPASPSVPWTVPPQPIAPTRPAAALEPTSASPVPGIGASGDSADEPFPSANTPLLSPNFAPVAPQARTATGETDQSQTPAASSASLPGAAQGEIPLSTSGAATPHSANEIISTSPAPAEASRSVMSNSVAQQSTVRIAPGAALPQHVVDAIMAAATESADQTPATIPANVMDSAARPDPLRQPNNAKSAASNLVPADTGLDRVERTPASANATTQIEAVSTSTSKQAASGPQQPVGRDMNQTVSSSPSRTADVQLSVLEPIAKASGANITMRYETPRSVPAEIASARTAGPSLSAVTNINVSEIRREELPVQPRIVVADQAAPSRIVSSGVADTNSRPQQISASVESAGQMVERPSSTGASPETASVRNVSATATANTAAKPEPIRVSDTPAVVAPETRQSPALATSWNGAAKPGDTPESVSTQVQKPIVLNTTDQTAKQQAAAVTDHEIANSGPIPKQQANAAEDELARTQTQQKPTVPAPADQIAKQTGIADPDLAPEPTQQKPIVAAPAEQIAKPQAAAAGREIANPSPAAKQTGTTDADLVPAQTQQKSVMPASAEQTAKPQPAIVADPKIVDVETASEQQTTEAAPAPTQTPPKLTPSAPADQIAKPQPVAIPDPDVANVDLAAKAPAVATDSKSTSAQSQQKPVVPAPAEQIAKLQTAGVINPDIAELDASAEPQTGTTDSALAAAQTQQKPVVPAAADQISTRQEAVIADPVTVDLDAQIASASSEDISPAASADAPKLADANSQATQKPAPVDQLAQSALDKSPDLIEPQPVTQARPIPTAVEVIDPAEMLVSETASAIVTDDVPAQMRGAGIKTVDSSPAAPKANGSSSASPNAKPQAAAAPATGASTSTANGDAGSDASADNSAADDSALQSQTSSASGKVESAQAAPSSPAIPVTVSANQTGGVTLMTGMTQTAVVPNVATLAATTAAATSSAPAAEPAPDIDSLAVAIAANTARGVKHFDIRLDPAELGRVDVHMSVSRDGKAEALITADRPETLELLQRDSKTLQSALKDAGLDLSNNSLNFSLKGQQRQGDGGGASMARMRSLSDAVVARAEAANASTPIWSHAPGSARLDIRV